MILVETFYNPNFLRCSVGLMEAGSLEDMVMVKRWCMDDDWNPADLCEHIYEEMNVDEDHPLDHPIYQHLIRKTGLGHSAMSKGDGLRIRIDRQDPNDGSERDQVVQDWVLRTGGWVMIRERVVRIVQGVVSV